MAKRSRRNSPSRNSSHRVASRASVAAWHRAVVGRLNEAAGSITLDEIARVTGANHETVRRYMHHGRIPAQFAYQFCLAFDVTPEWLLSGKGKNSRKGR